MNNGIVAWYNLAQPLTEGLVVNRCWAKSLGDCKGKITAEHIVTEKIWNGDEIGVSGLPWCRETHKFIGVANFTKNMLCERHNNTLSPVDAGGIAAFDTFRQAAKIHNQRKINLEAGFQTGRLDLCPYNFNGPLLERWLLKTLINMELAGDQNLPMGPYFHLERPAGELVEAAYGRRTLAGNAGLYMDTALGPVKMEERIRYVSLIGSGPSGDYVAAGRFLFFGFQFVLLLNPSVKTDGRTLIQRPNKLVFTINEQSSIEINITW